MWPDECWPPCIIAVIGEDCGIWYPAFSRPLIRLSLARLLDDVGITGKPLECLPVLLPRPALRRLISRIWSIREVGGAPCIRTCEVISAGYGRPLLLRPEESCCPAEAAASVTPAELCMPAIFGVPPMGN